ncbi:RNA polymerase II C-terminal domain phosphatase-like 5 [Cardamine amara subsp. amara]|uniref:protein-serine/threonine phosphatase n=1 Tax=Cardamine amara subsp. amara TaxID=228776 RepID=A0ABD1A8P6_CARAN
MSYHGYCGRCCRKVDANDGQLFNYISQGRNLSYKFVASMKRQRFEIGYGQRKLHLVVDLQHVLLDSRDDGVLVKLRPFAREFLREANELFTIYAYTKSEPKQARNFIKLLDPLNIFFPSRFITRADEKKKKKSLEFVLAEERGVVILDCNPETWDKDGKKNLLLIKSYDCLKEKEYQGPMITKFINFLNHPR